MQKWPQHLNQIYRTSLTLLLCFFLSNCTTKEEKGEPGDESQPITQLCNSSISRSAISAVKKITGSDDLYEDTPTQNAIIRQLNSPNNGPERVQACLVYRSSASNSPLQFEIEVTREETAPQATPEDKANGRSLYPIGEHATAGHGEKTSWAKIYFSCTKGAPSKESRFINSHIFVPQTSKNTVEPAMVILNSFSRKLAQEFGCEAEAKLPKRVPEPST